jgi:hypothetical protein
MSRTGPFQGHVNLSAGEKFELESGASAYMLQPVSIHETIWCHNPEGHDLKITIVKTSELLSFVVVNSNIGASSGNSFSVQGDTLLLEAKCRRHTENGV